MIKPPFKVRQGESCVWIEDSTRVTVCVFMSQIESPEAIKIAQLLANGANQYLARADHARKIGKKGGRPKSKHPTKSTLAKRKSRSKLKSP